VCTLFWLPYLLAFGDDRVIRYTGVYDISGGAGGA